LKFLPNKKETDAATKCTVQYATRGVKEENIAVISSVEPYLKSPMEEDVEDDNMYDNDDDSHSTYDNLRHYVPKGFVEDTALYKNVWAGGAPLRST
jgi:hypothetical protein